MSIASGQQKHARRRTSSNAAALAIRNGQHARKHGKSVIEPKSAHTADEFLQDFLDPSFDAAAFLNAKLPPLAAKQPGTAHASSSNAVPLAELSAQTQTLLSQLNTQTTRLSSTLTQLTDEILRGGSRLAYEVELLRGEALGLSETLNETLRDDIQKFVPGGLAAPGQHEVSKISGGDQGKGDANESGPSGDLRQLEAHANDAIEPECMKQLQTLTLVRERLDSVIKIFGDAMNFTFPPSEVSVSSGFLSVSAPEPGSAEQSSEEKGQQVLKALREEVSALLNQSDDPIQGVEKAAARVQELKELATVWKGTAEEKGRDKFLESLTKMVEDGHRDLVREMEQAVKRAERASAVQNARRGEDSVAEEPKGPGGFGLISQLQKLRNGLQ